jgi:carbon-monoxide dehydrogenase medium subunit
MTALEPDELVTGISFPDWPKGHITLFREVAQRPGDFALVGLVGALTVAGGKIARVGLGLVRHGSNADQSEGGGTDAARSRAA